MHDEPRDGPFLATLRPEDRIALIREGHERDYADGDQIVSEGTPAPFWS